MRNGSFARCRIAWLGVLLLGGCGDSIPLGPDLVECHCTCTTSMVSGLGSGGCGNNGCDLQPCPPNQVCSVTGGCVNYCDNSPPINTMTTSDDVVLHVCVDSSNPLNSAGACNKRCDDYASGSIIQCVDASLVALGVNVPVNDILPQSFVDQITPNAAQSLADILLEECGTWILDKITGTCGLETQGVSSLVDLLLCFVSLSPTQGLTGGGANAIRTCHSTPFPFPSSSPFQVQQINGCPEFEGHSPDGGVGSPMGGEPMPGGSNIDSANSQVSISGADVDPASANPQGFVSTGRIGPLLIISQLRGTLPNGHLNVKGHDVTLEGGFLELKKPIVTLTTADPVFAIPPGKVHFIITGSVNGTETSIESTNVTNIAGFYDEAAGSFGLAGSLALQGVDAQVAVNLVFKFSNRPPQANAGPDQTVECTLQTREGVVQLAGSQSYDPDPGDHIANYSWTVGKQFIASGPNAADSTAHVGLGQRVASLSTVDTHGSLARDVAVINVVDTKPPIFDSLTVNPGCLWPVNHKMVLLRLGQELQAKVHDACDPAAPRVFIKSVSSSQPALGGGSGNTTPDFVNGTAAVCLRAERDGTQKTPRVYTITIGTKDTTGNEADQIITVTVPHDQGGPVKCPNLDQALLVDDGDPACVANQPLQAQQANGLTPPDPHGQGHGGGAGCALAGGREPLLGIAPLVALALLLVRRRVRARR